MTMTQKDNFGELKLDKRIVAAVKEMGFEEPSPIQQQAIPLLLEGKDIIGQAQTGTGKTAAFGIPIIQGIEDHRHIQALVMSPTRELAIQVADRDRYPGSFAGSYPPGNDKIKPCSVFSAG